MPSKTHEVRLDQFLRRKCKLSGAGKPSQKKKRTLPVEFFDALCEGFDDLNTNPFVDGPVDELSGFGQIAREAEMPLDDLLQEVLERVPDIPADRMKRLAVEIDSYGGEGLDMLKEVVLKRYEGQVLWKLERVFVRLGC
jgi:hypothetical protein